MPRSLQEAIFARRYKLLFGVRRSVRYHSYRRQFYLNTQSVFSFVILLAGSASVMQLFKDSRAETWFEIGSPVVITTLAALSLVYRLSENASRHNDLYRRFVDLEKRFSQQSDWSEDVLDGLEEQRLEIEMDEPATYQALDRLCHNELVKSEGRPELAVRLGTFHRVLRNFVRFDALPIKA